MPTALLQRHKNLSKEIFKKYDTALLIKEKEGLYKTLNNRNSIYIWFILFLIICSGLLSISSLKIEKKNQKI